MSFKKVDYILHSVYCPSKGTSRQRNPKLAVSPISCILVNSIDWIRNQILAKEAPKFCSTVGPGISNKLLGVLGSSGNF